MAAFASVYQLGSLGNGISASVEKSFEPTIAPSMPTVAPVKPALPKNTFKPTRIVISDVEIDLPIVSQPLKKGTWDVMPQVANYAEGTSLVNSKNGNVGIYAHDQLIGFAKIKQLKKGATIYIYGEGYQATYTVSSSKVVKPTDMDVFEVTKEPTLTLITCDGEFSEKRYMIEAELSKLTVLKK